MDNPIRDQQSLVNESQVRYLQEMGPNLIKIIKYLLRNRKLLKLLYFTDKDPYSAANDLIIPQKDSAEYDSWIKEHIYKNGSNGLIRIIPIIASTETDNSIITLRVIKGVETKNSDFLDIFFAIEVFVPNTQWIIKDNNLRPYAIMGEVQKSLEGKVINGLGTISGSGFSTNFFTEEISAFIMQFRITQFQ